MISDIIVATNLKRNQYDSSESISAKSYKAVKLDSGVLTNSSKMAQTRDNIIHKTPFSDLSIDVDLNNLDSNEIIVSNKNRPKPVTPIIIKDTNISVIKIKEIFKKFNITTSTIKLLSDGIKLLFANKIDKTNVVNELKMAKIIFFGFEDTDEKPYKVVLSGLHEMEHTTLSQLLLAKEIKPFEIKTINKNQYNAKYLLYFQHGQTNLNTLRKTETIDYIKIKWSYYRRKRIGPTQCYKCQSYGHGTRNCFMPTKCLLCSGNHSVTNCHLNLIEPEAKKEKLKCSNCQLNHQSNSPECPKRNEYLEIKAAINRKNFKSNRNYTDSRPTFNSGNFPELIKLPNSNWINQFARKTPETNQPNREQPININQQQHRPADKDLGNRLTKEEIFCLINEAANRLSACRNATEQVQAILEITLKYVCPEYN